MGKETTNIQQSAETIENNSIAPIGYDIPDWKEFEIPEQVQGELAKNYTGSITLEKIQKIMNKYIYDNNATLKSAAEQYDCSIHQLNYLKKGRTQWAQFVKYCRDCKAEQLRETAGLMYQKVEDLDSLPDYMKTENQYGETVSIAGVKLFENKYRAIMERAGIISKTDKIQEKIIFNQINAGQVNINMKELMQSPIEELQRIDWNG